MLSLLGSLRGGGGASFVTNSLRLRSNASAYLSRTPSVAGNRKTWTWSAWVKRGALPGTRQALFSAWIDGTNYSGIEINPSNQIDIFNFVSNVVVSRITTNAVYRDPSSWYHILVSSNSSSLLNLYVNGVQVTSFSATVGPSVTDWFFNGAVLHQLGTTTAAGASLYFDGYLTEVNFIDGQALTPASFGAINSSTGVWAPSRYTGTYGANGFYLKFADASAATAAAIGKDSSGNGNNWTPSGISVTAGATYDSMLDVPVNYSDGGNNRGNYCTLNPLKAYPGFCRNGNLAGSVAGINSSALGTMSLGAGKWYWEVNANASCWIGVAATTFNHTVATYIGSTLDSWGYFVGGTKYNNTIASPYGASFASGDIIGFEWNNGSLTCYKNNVSQGVMVSGLTGDWFPAIGANDVSTVSINFGQRPFNTANGLPPAGFLALNTQNLPTPSIVNGANFMAATTYTGNAAARSLSNVVNNASFQPDLVWIKSRTPGATSHALFDSARGTTKYLSSNTTTAETTLAQSLTAFNADGFSLGTDTTLVNANANSYIAWQWKESALAGLDVVSYTGTGVDRTVAHNLGVAPAMVIVKRSQTGGTGNWQVRHTSIAAANSIQLNLPNAAAAATTVWASTAPSSSVFTVGTFTDVNASGIGYVAYCFAEIAGFSRFGSYTGNGSVTGDGPFVFCGFRPKLVMIKRTDVAANWVAFDSSRNPSNLTNLGLNPNDPAVEFTGTGTSLDILSNGIKARGAGLEVNISGATYIFAAFAEVPSKYALAR